MKMFAKVVFVTMGLTCVIGTKASAGEFFSDQGTIWTGGYVGFLQMRDRSDSLATTGLMVAPVFRYFPCKYLLVGPSFSWTTTSHGNSSAYSLSAGPEIGFAYGNNMPVIPYVLASIRYGHSVYTYSSTSLDQHDEGWELPIATGIVIPIVNGLGFQLETGYRYIHDHNYYSNTGLSSYNTEMGEFYIAVGVCGIGNKIGISLTSLILD